MQPLKHHLQAIGYECFVPDLKLTFHEIETSVFLFEGFVETIIQFHLIEGETIHFVGHSTGGLIIRKWLESTNYKQYIGRCVFVATPNNGSQLAEIATKIKPYANIFQTLKSLTKQATATINKDFKGIEMAAIAGNKNNLLFGQLIGGDNDGRIELESVFFPQLKAFTVLPYGHKEIHHQLETANYIDTFLKKGLFKWHLENQSPRLVDYHGGETFVKMSILYCRSIKQALGHISTLF